MTRKHIILTGTPGSGKTTLIRALEIQNYAVVEEAASGIILYEKTIGNELPWRKIKFIDDIILLQKHRYNIASYYQTDIIFHDRSPICTYALSGYLGYQPTKLLMEEINLIRENNLYGNRVFFIENLGFIKNTDARRISYEEALKFEQIHYASYQEFGFELIKVPVDSINKRIERILSFTELR